jgi:hypothetical protein
MRNQRRAATSSEVMAPAIKENRASSSSIAPSKASGKGEASGVSSDMERRAQNLESAIHRIAAGRHHSSKDVNVVTSSKKTEDDIAKALKSLGYGS